MSNVEDFFKRFGINTEDKEIENYKMFLAKIRDKFLQLSSDERIIFKLVQAFPLELFLISAALSGKNAAQKHAEALVKIIEYGLQGENIFCLIYFVIVIETESPFHLCKNIATDGDVTDIAGVYKTRPTFRKKEITGVNNYTKTIKEKYHELLVRTACEAFLEKAKEGFAEYCLAIYKAMLLIAPEKASDPDVIGALDVIKEYEKKYIDEQMAKYKNLGGAIGKENKKPRPDSSGSDDDIEVVTNVGSGSGPSQEITIEIPDEPLGECVITDYRSPRAMDYYALMLIRPRPKNPYMAYFLDSLKKKTQKDASSKYIKAIIQNQGIEKAFNALNKQKINLNKPLPAGADILDALIPDDVIYKISIIEGKKFEPKKYLTIGNTGLKERTIQQQLDDDYAQKKLQTDQHIIFLIDDVALIPNEEITINSQKYILAGMTSDYNFGTEISQTYATAYRCNGKYYAIISGNPVNPPRNAIEYDNYDEMIKMIPNPKGSGKTRLRVDAKVFLKGVKACYYVRETQQVQ